MLFSPWLWWFTGEMVPFQRKVHQFLQRPWIGMPPYKTPLAPGLPFFKKNNESSISILFDFDITLYLFL